MRLVADIRALRVGSGPKNGQDHGGDSVAFALCWACHPVESEQHRQCRRIKSSQYQPFSQTEITSTIPLARTSFAAKEQHASRQGSCHRVSEAATYNRYPIFTNTQEYHEHLQYASNPFAQSQCQFVWQIFPIFSLAGAYASAKVWVDAESFIVGEDKSSEAASWGGPTYDSRHVKGVQDNAAADGDSVTNTRTLPTAKNSKQPEGWD
jgi:hypothetical protein